jgi:Family of unknown function (DUF5681)
MAGSDELINKSNDIIILQPMSDGAIQGYETVEIKSGPNHGHRWQPGESGNPSGRPKTRLFSEALNNLLSKVSAADESGAERLGRKIFAMADQEDDQYLALAAIKEIRDSTEGKPVQRTMVRISSSDQRLLAVFDQAEPE